MTKIRWTAGLVLGLALLAGLSPAGRAAATFELREKDHIVIIGNTLAERLQYDGWLETMLYSRFPKHELVIRNLGFSGDEIATRLRSKNFGTPDEWLSAYGTPIGGYEDNRFDNVNTKADVIFAFFGYNESFAGEAGLDDVQGASSTSSSSTRSRRSTTARPRRGWCCSRRSRTRIWAIPTCRRQGQQRQAGAVHEAMDEVASPTEVAFVDLFTPTAALSPAQGAADDQRRASER